MIPSWNVSAPGMVQCNATNRIGYGLATSYVYLRNFEEDMQFKLVSPTDEVLYGENIVIECAVDIYNFTRNVTVSHALKNSFPHASSITIQDRYAWKTTYENHVSRQTFSRNAEFICEAIDKQGSSWSRSLQFTIYDPISPHATGDKTVRHISLAASKSTTLVCNIDGAPPPKFTWLKNNDLHSWRNDTITVTLEEGETKADYICIGWSKLGKANITWHIVRESTFEDVHVASMGAVGTLVLVLLVITTMQVRENRHLREQLYADSHSLSEME
uniref:Ig-like domain-containing protein n=1 Tax=Anopheles atroparvus TaxID=41427 RepID=A0AAG5D7I5_ANOAO